MLLLRQCSVAAKQGGRDDLRLEEHGEVPESGLAEVSVPSIRTTSLCRNTAGQDREHAVCIYIIYVWVFSYIILMYIMRLYMTSLYINNI